MCKYLIEYFHFRNIFYALTNIFMRDVTSGAQTTLFVALDPALEGITGKYFE